MQMSAIAGAKGEPRSDHWRKLLIKETLMIQQRNPDLNSDKASIPLYLFNL